ncbi:MAG: NAD(P)-dependent oxidoreductase [Rhodospirillales bacterium]|nr:NAD(P)-dependent oxidoreductase [Rhodospirillales bacterium]
MTDGGQSGAQAVSPTVLDARHGLAARFAVQAGARAGMDGAALAAGSDVVITTLPTSVEVRRVLAEGNDGVLSGLAPRGVIIEMTLGQAAVTRALAAEVAARGAVMIDAPVSGGVTRAKSGELAIMVGGDPAMIDRVRGVLETMGATVLRTGDVGSGQAMKALNNLVAAGGFLIDMEALMIDVRLGLDPSLMVDVLNVSSGKNNSIERKFKQAVLSRRFNSGFALDLMLKDISIALELGERTMTPAPLSVLCPELWAAAALQPGPGHDHTEAARLVERLAGQTLCGVPE